ncbi:MAG TPA: recombinase family protein [Candidatus Limnocylindrales bacterium]
MARPYIYMRKSSVRDITTDMSPETQEREVRALAARHGDKITDRDVLADWDISGRAKFTRKRVEYLRLVAAIEADECSAVYSYSWSRVGRSVAELARFLDLCAAHRVPVRLVVDAVDTSTASGRLLANVLGSVSQFEAEVAGERLLAMYATKRARAIERGEDPVDAVRTSKRYGERPGEDADLVLKTFRETGSFSKAARKLNQLGLKPRDSSTWWASSVGVVVERLDPMVAARTKRVGYKSGGTPFALAGLLRCPTDGAMLTGSRMKTSAGFRARYACRHGEGLPHPRVAISEHLILPAIEAEAARYRDPDEDAGPDRRATLKAELEARRQRVVESRLDGIIDRGEAVRQVAEIDMEVARLDRPPVRDLRTVAGRTPIELNAILRQLFERIDLDPVSFQPVHFEWRDPSERAAT